MNGFLEAQYFIAYNGFEQGNIFCHSVQHLQNVLGDLFPNPGDPDRAYLLNPANWERSMGDDLPYCVELRVHDEPRGTSEIRIYRVKELES